MITLPTNFTVNLTSVMGSTFSDLLPLILFIGGVVFAVYIITSILSGGIGGADKK